MYQAGCCFIDKYFSSGMHLEHDKAEIIAKQKAAGPSPHPTFPECHLLPVFLPHAPTWVHFKKNV